MHLHTHLRSSVLVISTTRCPPQPSGKGAPEAPALDSLAFVRRGAYRIHRANFDAIIHPLTAQFFTAGEEYAISHPLGCGDECLDIEVPPEVLEEARPATWSECPGIVHKRRSCTVPIPADIQREVCLMAGRLEARLVSDLEGEECALAVLRNVGAVESSHAGTPAPGARLRGHGRARKKVEAAKEILLSDLGRNWSLLEIAGLVSTSPYHLTRLVRRLTGAPLHRFLNRQRLAEALYRVSQGANDLTALAIELGFSSHSHFSAAFRREYGLPPSQARAPTGSR